MNRNIYRLIVPLCLAVSFLNLNAVSALAAPELAVTLERDSAAFPVVHHSDERVDFMVKVENTASKTEEVAAGTMLTCNPNESSWNGQPGFTFRWLSGGVQVGSGATYEVQPSDAGHALQCVVIGENSGGASAAFTLPLQVAPPPTPSAPAYSGSGQPRPLIGEFETASAGSEITCTAPTSWTGSPSWTFEWLNNGGPSNGEITATTSTTSTYKVAAADVPGALQCVAIAHTGSGESPAGGTAASISPVKLTSPEPSPFPPASDAFQSFPSWEAYLPFIVDPNATTGPVTLELELPGGDETFAFKTESSGWSCENIPASGDEHARVICRRENVLSPGEEFPSLRVIAALGRDAPDIATAVATAFGGGSAAASDEIAFPIAPAVPFGISKFIAALVNEIGDEDHQAGGHPFAAVSEVVFNQKRALAPLLPSSPFLPIGTPRQIVVDLPRGVVGNPLAIPELCAGIEAVENEECPSGSLVGELGYRLPELGGGELQPIYAIAPEFGAPVQFAFRDTTGRLVIFTPRLRPEDGYAVSLEVSPLSGLNLLESTVKFCGFGKAGITQGCRAKGDAAANPKPFFTNPTRCGVPLSTRVRLNSWSDPTFVEGPAFDNAQITGCDLVPFEPKADLRPSSDQADSPTGFDVHLSMPEQGLENPAGIAQSELREAKVTLPEGMAINPTAAEGLGACSAEEIKLGTNDPIACPRASKIGTVEVETPLIAEPLNGAVYLAKQDAVEGSLIGFYLVFDSPKNGILVKQPVKVTPDPNTGQLVVTVAESPEQPFSAVRMHFPGGARATLLTPPKCGTYGVTSELTPWSGGASVTQKSTFGISEGPGGSPCPTGALNVHMSSGSVDTTAGKTSPFVVHLNRNDGSQRFTALSLHMPPGLTAYLKGVPYCPDSVLAAIPSAPGTGHDQIGSPSCPTASQIGHVVIGAGAGSNPLYVDTGRAYLAGPYKGAPLSIAVVAPAVAGPLDLGNVVVRNALRIDPETAQVNVISDPIPTILYGVLLDVKDIRISIDRDHFTVNPTDCEPMSVGAEVKGETGESATLSNRFQVDGCDNLKFAPKLGVRLFGGTRRGRYPRLTATLKGQPGEANLARAAVVLPHSEFLAQEHIRTVCTRVQFAAEACPPGSSYGHAKAITPLLAQPLVGPVYLRSSSHELPDLVVDLRGPNWQPIETVVVGRIDSTKGRIRTTFENTPDVPLTKFTLQLQGGKKGLLVNSTNICRGKHKAKASLTGQNGKRHALSPLLKARCGGKAKGRHKH